MLSDTERHRLLSQGAGTPLEFDRHARMHDLLTRQAARTPDAIAIVHGSQRASYSEIDSRSNRLAQALRRRGVGPEVLVGLYLDRSIDLLVAVVAILKAGGAYVPLDPAYPADRVAFMLEDTSARLIVSQQKLREGLPSDVEVLCLDRDADEIAGESDQLPESGVRSENLGYIIYTSGSTGTPKGVALEHRQAVALVEWAASVFSREELSGVLFSTSICFDLSIFEIFLAFRAGGKLVLVENLLAIDSLSPDAGVTLVNTVPSVLSEVVKRRDLPSSVTTITTGGEALPTALVDRLYAMPSITNVVELYGPSETTTYSTFYPRVPGEVPCIGRSIANVTSYVLDEARQLVAEGETGELYHGGVCVARGYWRRPELSAERFVPDPFAAELGAERDGPGSARMYRTGDLARWRGDGNLEFVGRVDNQVKIRGFRVELGEIESVLEELPDVAQAIVLARDEADAPKRLVAYVVGRGGRDFALGELREHLATRLPDYMLPSAVVNLSELPLTPNGKTDRKALPPPSRERPALDHAYVAPRGRVETFLCERWQQLLQIDAIGVRDRFFDLGGTSLLAAQFIRGMEAELGANIYIVSIFDAPSVAEYAAFLERDYAAQVASRFGVGAASDSAACASQPLGDADVALMQTRIYKLAAQIPVEPLAERNRQALFVLAPPRSGTTLLRVMLAGHPGVFAGAELQLLGFHTLAERRDAFSGKFSVWREGTIRALMELRGCDPKQAQDEMESYEQRGFTTKQMYRVLQELAGDRLLVDKSPSYALDSAALEKAERDFDRPLYIQLVRHPLAMIDSFAKYHMDQVLFLEDHDFTPTRLAELTWLVTHENVTRFLENVPSERWVRVRYEDLVVEPEAVLRGLCDQLGIPYHEDLANPYKDIEHKMVDGVFDVSAPMGDTRLLSHGRIDASLADSWKSVTLPQPLSQRTWSLAERFGYQRPADASLAGDDLDARRRRARSTGLDRGRLARRKQRGEDRG